MGKSTVTQRVEHTTKVESLLNRKPRKNDNSNCKPSQRIYWNDANKSVGSLFNEIDYDVGAVVWRPFFKFLIDHILLREIVKGVGYDEYIVKMCSMSSLIMCLTIVESVRKLFFKEGSFSERQAFHIYIVKSIHIAVERIEDITSHLLIGYTADRISANCFIIIIIITTNKNLLNS